MPSKRSRPCSNTDAEPIAVKADVSEQDDVSEMIDHVRKTFGRLDILVSNAATGGFRLVIGASARNFEAAMNTNVRALMFLVQSALPLLERSEGRAKVVALSSHGSHMALPMYGLIGASKAALESLVRHLTLGNRRPRNQSQRRHGGPGRNRFDPAHSAQPGDIRGPPPKDHDRRTDA